jgi:hypothetical protein
MKKQNLKIKMVRKIIKIMMKNMKRMNLVAAQNKKLKLKMKLFFLKGT